MNCAVLCLLTHAPPPFPFNRPREHPQQRGTESTSPPTVSTRRSWNTSSLTPWLTIEILAQLQSPQPMDLSQLHDLSFSFEKPATEVALSPGIEAGEVVRWEKRSGTPSSSPATSCFLEKTLFMRCSIVSSVGKEAMFEFVTLALFITPWMPVSVQITIFLFFILVLVSGCLDSAGP